MSNNEHLLPVQTASAKQSIWWDVKLDPFRRHVIALQQASNKVPSDPQDYSARSWLARRTNASELNYVLSIDAEQRLTDDLAFIAAAEEGVKTISAVTLEQDVEGVDLTVRLAANETIPKLVPSTFKNLFEQLAKCASKRLSRHNCSESLFDQVLILSQNRIHGRLQSAFWKSPSHRKRGLRTPLYSELQAVSLRIEKLPSNKRNQSRRLWQKLDELCELFRRVDAAGDSTKALGLLKVVAKQCYAVSTSDGISTLEETVTSYGYTPNDVCRNKHIRQVYKLGRYWGLCLYMAEASRKYDRMFHNIRLETLCPYRGLISPISFKGVPAECHVHAEIQLLVFYDSDPPLQSVKPRVLGVSKAACYLCDLFVKEHAEFFISKTHGQLYDQWNVPNLATFSNAQRRRYRTILRDMDAEIQTVEERERYRPWWQKRQEALGSWLNLTTVFPLSPIASDAGTVLSGVKSTATIAGPSGTKTPRALSPAPRPRSLTRAERLERRNMLEEVQATKKIPGTPEEPPTLMGPTLSEASPMTTQPPPTDLLLLAVEPSVDPPPPAPRPVASPMPSSLSTLGLSAPPPVTSPIPPSPSTLAPSSPPTPVPLAVSNDQPPKPRARISAPKTPSPAPSTATELPSSPSSSSIQSWEYPIERTITAHSPFRSRHGKLNLIVEIEGPSQGNVAITNLSASEEPAVGIPVNVRAMKENEILHLERGNEDESIMINLQNSRNQSMQVALKWV